MAQVAKKWLVCYHDVELERARVCCFGVVAFAGFLLGAVLAQKSGTKAEAQENDAQRAVMQELNAANPRKK